MSDDVEKTGEEKRPIYQVTGPVERCATCGSDDPQVCMGHTFEPMPWPVLPPAEELQVTSEYREPLEPRRGGKVIARATHLPSGRSVSASRTRTDVEHAIQFVPSAAERQRVEDAARLLWRLLAIVPGALVAIAVLAGVMWLGYRLALVGAGLVP